MEQFNANNPNGNGRRGIDRGPRKIDTLSAQSVLNIGIGGDGITAGAPDLSWRRLRQATWRASGRDKITSSSINKER